MRVLSRRYATLATLAAVLAGSLLASGNAEAMTEPVAPAREASTSIPAPIGVVMTESKTAAGDIGSGVDYAQAVKRAQCACPPPCVCNNQVEYAHARAMLHADPLNLNQLKARFGNTSQGRNIAGEVYYAMYRITQTEAPPLHGLVPFPDYKAASTSKYWRTPYHVYEIFTYSLPPVVVKAIWKYGITRQAIAAQRPERQLPACNRHYHTGYQKCSYVWRWHGQGWFAARSVEAALTLEYARDHNGHCPPGMPACI
jgi:hypothetical protein